MRNNNNRVCFTLKKTVCCILLLNFTIVALAQVHERAARSDTRVPVTKQKMLADTIPVKRPIFTNEVKITDNRRVFNNFSTVDTVWNLKPYLQTKSDCDFIKYADDDGCVIVKYSDGFIKKICDTSVKEVTLPSGKKYVLRYILGIRSLVMSIPPPPNPPPTETAYDWLIKYNESLLKEIKNFLGDNIEYIQKYSQKEATVCKGFMYKQIEYRTIFIEEFLKAK